MAIGTHHTRHEFATDDWITPPEIIEALGPFDFDPCSCVPQPFRTAAEMWTDGGLRSAWPEDARTWLNPPYGPQLGLWLARMANHDIGTALVFARTETSTFFKSVWPVASAILFVKGRLNFYFPNGKRSPRNSGGPSVLIAYGELDAEILMACEIPGAKVRLKGNA